jgi:polyisoprenoid-binding protein YceI
MIRTLGLVALLAAGLAPAAEPAPSPARPLLAEKSEIAFTVTQMGVKVTGAFKRFSARVEVDPAAPETGTAAIDVEIASLTTGNEDADAIALDKPWLDAKGFPKATFRSRQVKALGSRYEVRGALTIKGKARDIAVPLELVAQPDGGAIATGEFTLRRTDFGIGGGEWNEDDLVANDVPVRFRLVLGAPKK